jgi:hypothetical protein
MQNEPVEVTRIPASLAPFLQEYNLAQINPQTAAPLLMERTLQYGNRTELRWLFAQYPRPQIVEWVKHYGKDRLPHPHIDFWLLVLEIAP